MSITKFKKIVVFSLIAYALSFLVSTIVMFSMGIDFETFDVTNMSMSLWVVAMAATALITYIVTKWYFRTKWVVVPSAKEGFIFGVAVVVIGFVLDFLLVLPVVITQGANDLLAYYQHPFFGLTVLILLGTATIVGWHDSQALK